MLDEGDGELPAAILAVRRVADDRVDLARNLVDLQEVVPGADGVDPAGVQRVDQKASTAVAGVPGALGLGQVAEQQGAVSYCSSGIRAKPDLRCAIAVIPSDIGYRSASISEAAERRRF
jgi:hypothetical protein